MCVSNVSHDDDDGADSCCAPPKLMPLLLLLLLQTLPLPLAPGQEQAEVGRNESKCRRKAVVKG